MNIEQLRSFAALVEEGSFTNAGRALYLSHSTVSRNLTALEEEFGTVFVKRNTRNLRLTASGHILYKYSKDILGKIVSLKLDVEEEKSQSKLSLGRVVGSSRVLDKCCSLFCEDFPKVNFEINKLSLNGVYEDVLAGVCDVGFGFSYALPEEMEAMEKFTFENSEFCVIIDGEDKLCKKEAVDIKSLRPYTYIDIDEEKTEFTKSIEEKLLYGREKHYSPKVNSLEALLLKIKAGAGISLVPKPLADSFFENCGKLHVKDLNSSFGLVAFWRKDNENENLKSFIEILKNESGGKK